MVVLGSCVDDRRRKRRNRKTIPIWGYEIAVLEKVGS
jgi:hypothetical protein